MLTYTKGVEVKYHVFSISTRGCRDRTVLRFDRSIIAESGHGVAYTGGRVNLLSRCGHGV
jgi:hypothetical protein